MERTNYLYDFAFNIYLFLFHPKYFFEKKKEKADDLKAALPYFLVGIGLASFSSPFSSISNSVNLSFPLLASLVSEYVDSIYIKIIIFFIETTFAYIIIKLLGEKLPYRNFLGSSKNWCV